MTAAKDPSLRILLKLFVSSRVKAQLPMAHGDLALASLSTVIPDLLGKALRHTALICPWNPRSSEVWSFNCFRSKFKCPSPHQLSQGYLQNHYHITRF